MVSHSLCNNLSQRASVFILHWVISGGSTPYNGLYGEAPGLGNVLVLREPIRVQEIKYQFLVMAQTGEESQFKSNLNWSLAVLVGFWWFSSFECLAAILDSLQTGRIGARNKSVVGKKIDSKYRVKITNIFIFSRKEMSGRQRLQWVHCLKFTSDTSGNLNFLVQMILLNSVYWSGHIQYVASFFRSNQ